MGRTPLWLACFTQVSHLIRTALFHTTMGFVHAGLALASWLIVSHEGEQSHG